MKIEFPAYLRILTMFFGTFALLEYLIDSGEQPAFIRYPIVILVMVVFLLLLIAAEVVLAAANNFEYQLLSDEEKKRREEIAAMPATQPLWFKKLMHSLTRSEPIENETLLLHHDYDGIKELDNNLPPWWVYLFYGTIVFSAIYLVRYEILDGDDQEMEFAKEMAVAKIEVEEYKKNAPDLMDENSVVLLADAEALAKGKTIYEMNCAACHRADGGGQIGPNLTDENWILGGGIKKIFHTVSNGGRDGKGMIAWKATLKPKEIQQVSSYIISLKGTNPKEPKAAEGEVYIEEAKTVAVANAAK